MYSFTKFSAQNSDIKEGLKKFSLLFRQAKIIFVIVWFLDHFTIEYVPSMNSIWIITSLGLFHVWVTKFKTFLKFFKLSILTSNNVIWLGLHAILFNEAQDVVKISKTGYVPVFYEAINLFIKPQNFLLMFFICKFKGLYLIVMVCDGLLMLSLDLYNSCIKPTWYDVFQDVLFKCFTLGFFAFDYDIHDSKD